MAKNSIPKKEVDSLRMIFDALDDEKDGELELKEFVMQLNEKFDIKVKVEEMIGIMKQIDLDGDDMIQYTEFLLACCNKRSLFTDINIKKCFDYIDSNLDGEICDKDLKIFMGDSANDY